jgi:hypothetical protein
MPLELLEVFLMDSLGREGIYGGIDGVSVVFCGYTLGRLSMEEGLIGPGIPQINTPDDSKISSGQPEKYP